MRSLRVPWNILVFPDCSARCNVPIRGTIYSSNPACKPCRFPTVSRLRMQQVEIPVGKAPRSLVTGCRSLFFSPENRNHIDGRAPIGSAPWPSIVQVHNLEVCEYGSYFLILAPNLRVIRDRIIDNPQAIRRDG